MTNKKQKRPVFKILALFFILSGCLDHKPDHDSALRLKFFSITLDTAGLKPVVMESEDGYEGKLIVKSMDTIHFNLGYDIDNLAEKDKSIIYFPFSEDSIRSLLDTALVDPAAIIYTAKSNYDIDEFRKQNVHYISVSGYRAKITVPREIEKGGITGVYVDSLRKDIGGRFKFNLYASDLDSLQSSALLKMISTIQFHLNK